jgi:methyl-accepting chemotaxis protein
MPTSELIEIYGALITTLGILFAAFKYIISARIAPIELENKRLKNMQEKLHEEIEELKGSLLEEVKNISQDNFEFRLKYESGINEIKLLLAEKHVSKRDLDKAIEEVNKKIDQNTELSHNIKSIMESLNDLNS